MHFYATVPVHRTGNAQMIHVDFKWGLKAGDWVNLELWPVDNPEKKILTTKKLSRRGNGVGLYCRAGWGLTDGMLVSYRLEKVDDETAGSCAETEAEGGPQRAGRVLE